MANYYESGNTRSEECEGLVRCYESMGNNIICYERCQGASGNVTRVMPPQVPG